MRPFPKHKELGNQSPSSQSTPTFSTHAVSTRSSSSLNYIAHALLFAYTLSAPLSIALSQLAVFAFTLTVLLAIVKQHPAKSSLRYSIPNNLATPVLLWVGVSLLASLVGVSVSRSSFEFLKTVFYLAFPFAVFWHLSHLSATPRKLSSQIQTYLLGFVLGQTLAAIHTIYESFFVFPFSFKPPGAVTESGQLVMILPLLVALLLECRMSDRAMSFLRSPQFFAVALGLSLVLLSWSQNVAGQTLTISLFRYGLLAVLLMTLIVSGIFQTRSTRKNGIGRLLDSTRDVTDFRYALWIASSLLFCALIFNLKRGPWLGVFIALTVIGLMFSKRLLLANFALAFLILIPIGPARDRLKQYADDFFISGGRQEMWELGLELAERFPLGIGLDNAAYMRTLDPSLPELHRHMHNNLLNIAVETGILGMLVYLWWMYTFIKLGFTLWSKTRFSESDMNRYFGRLAVILSCAILGWQLAGCVEYNFGDGEVRLVAFFIMGVLMSLAKTVVGTEAFPQPLAKRSNT